MSKKIIFALLLALCMAITLVPGFAETEEVACEHTYAQTVETVGDCLNDTVYKFTCSKCGDTKTETLKAPGKHNYVPTTLKEGDCKTKALVKWDCAACKDSYYEAKEVHVFVEDYKEANCSGPAWAGEICALCGAKGVGSDVPGTTATHAWVLDVDNKNLKFPTCTEGGKLCYYCDATDCPYLKANKKVLTKEEEVAKLGHDFKKTETFVDHGCATPGGYLYECSRCDATEVQPLLQNGKPVDPAVPGKHTFDLNTKTVDATCKTEGYILKTCTVCGEQVKEKNADIDPTAHVSDIVSVLKAATCETDGIGKYACKLCGKAEEYKIISKDTAHDLVAEKLTEATCAKAGELVSICSICNKTVKQTIPATGVHNYTEGYKKVACDQPMRVGIYCTVCKLAYGEDKAVGTEVAGHNVVLNPKDKNYAPVEPCSEATGLLTYKCTDCTVAIDPVVVKGDHKFVITKIEVKATCGQPGGLLKVCELCNKEEVEILKNTDGSYKYPAPQEHNLKYTITENATCVAAGYTYQVCDDCGEIVNYTVLNKNNNAHSIVNLKTLKAATCTADGIGKFGCELCGKATEEYRVLSKEEYGHDIYEAERKDATCGKAGSVKYACTKCDYTKTVTLDILVNTPHTWKEDYTAPTCTKNSFAGLICSVCGAQKGEMTEVEGTKLGHDYVYIKDNKKYPFVEATCGKEGSGWKYCVRCDAKCKNPEKEIFKALEHKFATKGYIVEPTCTENGGMRFDCTLCNGYKIEAFTNAQGQLTQPSAGGHQNGKAVTVKATCAKVAVTTQTCKICGEVTTTYGEAKDPTNHEWNLVKTLKPSTCTTNGIGLYECVGCEAVEDEYRAIEASHTWDAGVVISAANCGYGEKREKTCTVCGKKQTFEGAPTGEKHQWIKNLVNYASNVIYQQCEVCGNREIMEDLRPAKPDGSAYTVCETYGCNFVNGVCTVCKGKDPDYVPHTHKYTSVVTAPTCTVDGYTTHTCECGDTYTDTTVKAAGHTKVVVPGIDADCVTPGLSAGEKCSVCGTELLKQNLIEALGHKFDKGVCTVCGAKDPDYVDPHTHEFEKKTVAATCTTAGSVTYTCACGEKKVEEIAALGHAWEITKAAACEVEGVKTCATCGAAEKIAALTHKEEVVAGKAATCAAAGLTEGKKCSVCGKTLVEQKEIPALAHTFKIKWIFNADVTKKAQEKTCTVCGHKEIGEWTDVVFE